MVKFDRYIWTSNLSVTSSLKTDTINQVVSKYEEMLTNELDYRTHSHELENPLRVFNALVSYGLSKTQVDKALVFSAYDFKRKGYFDCTGFMKGLFIGLLAQYLYINTKDDFSINFGGDFIIYHRVPKPFELVIEWWNNKCVLLKPTESFVIGFSSDNTSNKRGKHIKSSLLHNLSSTLVLSFSNPNLIVPLCVEMDCKATEIVADKFTIIRKCLSFIKINPRNVISRNKSTIKW